MARFIPIKEQNIIPIYQPENVEFYANLLNKAQSDLERSTAIKQAAIDKMGDLPFFTKEDRDATLGRVQELLKNATDADFVSPSKVSNAVMQANAEVLPGIHALKAKAKAADMYEKMQLAYGPNAWLSADPRQQSIVDPNTGRFVDPNKFKAVGINAEEVDKVFLASQLSNLTRSSEKRVASDLPGYYKLQKTTGLTDAERDQYYKPGSPTAIAEAQRQLTTMPQLKEVFGSEEAALARLMERNYQTSGAYKQSVDNQYMENENVLSAYERARLAAANDSSTPPPLFQPVEGDVATVNVTNDILKAFIPDNSAKITSSDIMFDKNGRIIPIKPESVPSGYSPYAGSSGAFAPSAKEKGQAYSKNIAQNKMISSMRESMRLSGLNVIQDSKTGKMRARTDKEVFDFYNQAATNSANVYGRNFEINPGLGIIGANGFFQADGKRKDFRNMNIEIDRNDGKGWQPVEETSEFAEELGFDISTGKEAGEFNAVLKTLGDGVYDFMGGSSKIRTAATNKDGKEISIRYNTTPNVTSYKRPVVELYSAFTKPIPPTKDENGDIRGKEIVVGQDFDTGKPVKVEVVSDFTMDSQGRPIIQPVVLRISNDSKAGIEYTRAYMSGGYPALLAIINTNTDRALIGNKGVYTKKTTNLREVIDEE